MSRIYFVHECNGERFDGTSFYWAKVDYREGTKKGIKAAMTPYDIKKEFYTEHHSFQFFNTKSECDAYEAKARKSGLWGNETWYEYDTDGGNVCIGYNYDKKEKRVYLSYKSRFGYADEKHIRLDFTFDGKLISGEDEYHYIQYMQAIETVQKYEELIMQFTKKNEEEVI